MVTCPRCKGEKQIVASHVSYAGGSSGWGVPLKCSQCDGKGDVPDEMLEWIATGRKLRDMRVAAGETLRVAAKKLMMRPSELSAMEQGRVKPNL